LHGAINLSSSPQLNDEKEKITLTHFYKLNPLPPQYYILGIVKNRMGGRYSTHKNMVYAMNRKANEERES